VNREQRRAAEARAKMQRNSERVKELVETGHTLADELDRYKAILFSLAREQGRIRVKAEHLKALTENDRIDFVHQANGDVIVQYTQGSR
jgi:hypothetical protein